MSVQERLQRWHITTGEPAEAKKVWVVLPLTLLTIVVTPLLADSRLGVLLSLALIGGGALLTLSRSGVRSALRHSAMAIVVLSVVVGLTTSSITGDQAAQSNGAEYWMHLLTLLSFAFVLLLTPALMVIRLLMRPRITLDTVAGALAAYLQVGIFFAVLYRIIDIAGDGHFFAQGAQPIESFQYFSFITLTTVGYGDLTPAAPLGQLLASLEALTGQLFLVSVVALVVGNLGRDLPHRRTEGSAATDTDPPGTSTLS